MMTPTPMSRRRVLGATAWTAPAIVVASAAPAMAASNPGTASFAYRAGTTYPFLYDFNGGYPSVYFQGASIEARGTDIPAGALQFTVTAVDADTGAVLSLASRGFSLFPVVAANGTSATWANAGVIPIGTASPLDDTDHFIAYRSNGTTNNLSATFTIVFRLGSDSQVATYTYRAPAAVRPSSRPYGTSPLPRRYAG